jgi:hypothetical protein
MAFGHVHFGSLAPNERERGKQWICGIDLFRQQLRPDRPCVSNPARSFLRSGPCAGGVRTRPPARGFESVSYNL